MDKNELIFYISTFSCAGMVYDKYVHMYIGFCTAITDQHKHTM